MTWILRKIGILSPPPKSAPQRDMVKELEQQSIMLEAREREPAERCRKLDETIRMRVDEMLQLVPPEGGDDL